MPARRMVNDRRLFDLCRKACLLPSGLDERFHDANAGNDFLDQRAERGGLILDRGGKRLEPAAEEFRHKHEQRQQDQDQEAEAPVHRQEEGDASDEGNELLGGVDRRLGDDRLNDRDIVHEAGEQLAGPAPCKKAHREGLQMRKEMTPKVGHDALGHRCGQIAVSHRTEPLNDDQSEKQGDELAHSAGIMLDGDDVPQHSGKAQQREIDGGDRHHKQAGQHHAEEIRFQEWTEARKGRHGKG